MSAVSISDFLRRRVHLTLRGCRSVEGRIHVLEQQTLASFLTTRHVFANLTDVRWQGPECRTAPHLAIRVSEILWGMALDSSDGSVNHTVLVAPRWAQITLEDSSILDVRMHVPEWQRLSDFFDAAAGFLSVHDAVSPATGHRFGDLAVNASAVIAVRELDD
jgi:hypothetical protein